MPRSWSRGARPLRGKAGAAAKRQIETRLGARQGFPDRRASRGAQRELRRAEESLAPRESDDADVQVHDHVEHRVKLPGGRRNRGPLLDGLRE